MVNKERDGQLTSVLRLRGVRATEEAANRRENIYGGLCKYVGPYGSVLWVCALYPKRKESIGSGLVSGLSVGI